MKTTIDATVIGGTSIHYKTGNWREFRPVFISRIAPCREACPAGIDIQGFLWEARYQRFDQAWKIIMEENPFPSICGRVCGHPCENACNRKEFDEPVSIHAIERFIGDYGLINRLNLPVYRTDLNKRVAIIGSGPTGLSCAYHLRRLGYEVKVFERSTKAGGMLRWGIPEYRLPETILEQEIEKLGNIGIEIETSVSLGKEFLSQGLKEFEAIFMALGSQRNRKMGISGEDLLGVQSGLYFLRQVKEKRNLHLGEKVTVVGGGNTAIDVARTALRLGSKPIILYRRTQEEMPAVVEEIEEAIKEGVRIEFLTSPVSILKKNEKGFRLECVKNCLGEPGPDGRRRPVPVEGSNFFIETDIVLTAIGETIETDHLLQSLDRTDSGIVVDEWKSTNTLGIFAGGDVTDGPRTVSHAIGSGKRAALAIDAYLRELDYDHLRSFLLGKKGSLSMAQRLNPIPQNHRNDQVVSFEDLNDYCFDHKPMKKMPQISNFTRRMNSFDEVNLGFSERMVLEEAERCFRCGMCSFCENCYIFCPDSAVIKKDEQKLVEIDYEFCKGCGICAHECSSHFIEMTKEKK